MKRITALLLSILLCAILSTSTLAAEVDKIEIQSNAKEIIFVLDTSNSMNGNDAGRLAGDSIKQMAYSLPSNYSIGFVAYNTDVTASIPPAQSREWGQIAQMVDAVAYTGYTNAGAALLETMSLFSPDTEKSIVLISDGEIVQEDEAQTAVSVEQFKSAVALAVEQNVPIYTIALGDELNDPENNIFDASEKTGGKIYRSPTADRLQDTVREILFTELGVKKSSVGVSQAAQGNNTLSVSIPVQNAAKARILLTTDGELTSVTANYNASGGEIITGKRFAVVEIVKPQRQAASISFLLSQGTAARAELITEYTGELRAMTTYRDITYEKENRVERSATLALSLHDPDSGISLLDDDYFGSKEAEVTIGDQLDRIAIQGGTLLLQRPITQNEELPIALAFPDWDINLTAPAETRIALEAPIQPPPPRWSTAEIAAVLIGATVLIGAVILALLVRKKKTSYQTSVDYSYGFSGKLDVYIVWARGGEYEIPPFTFPLGQLVREKRINLAQVLLSGNVKLEFPEAHNIWFLVGPERSILIKNNSKSEILFAGSAVGQGGQAQLSYGQKVYISFKRDVDEIEIYYRNVKESVPGGTERQHSFGVRA